MSILIKEAKVEAKGVSKNNKKYTLYARDDSTLHFLCGNKEDEVNFQLDSKFNFVLEKKKISLVNEEQQINYTISFNNEEEASQWADVIKVLIEDSSAKYFGVDLSQTMGSSMVSFIIEDTIKRLENSKDTNGLFRVSGSKYDVEKLKNAYRPNNMDLLNQFDDNVVTGFLKLYLRLLPDPLCTFDHYEDFLACARSDDVVGSIKKVVQNLPEIHRANLRHLMLFLKDVSLNSNVNMMTSSNLSIVIAPNILRPKVEATNFSNESDIANRVIEQMIEHAEIIFDEKPKGSIPLNPKLPPKKQPPIPKAGYLPLPPKNPLKNPGSPSLKTPPKYGLPPLPTSLSNPIITTPVIPDPIVDTTQNEETKDKLVRSPSEKQLSKSKRDTIHVDDAWKEYETEDGRKYYHNEITNVTQWEKPESFESSKSTRVKKHKKRSSNVEKTRSVTLSTPKFKKIVKDDSHTVLKGLSSPLIPPPLIAPPPEINSESDQPKKNQKDKSSSTKQLTDTERIAELEKRVSELEKLVKTQGQLIDKLLSKT